jgi:UDP-glucose 4-epimerase
VLGAISQLQSKHVIRAFLIPRSKSLSKVIVTGGCGFIGSAIVDVLLALGHEVHVIDNMSLGKNHWLNSSLAPRIHAEDILNAERTSEIFRSVSPQIVIHMAAHHFIPFCESHPFEAYALNVGGTLNVLEASRQGNVEKLFFASTGDVYPPSFAPHREVDMVSPIYVYGHTKFLAEQICIKYFETHLRDASLLIGRIFNATGRRETNPHLIPEVVKQIAMGKRTVEVGNLWPKRDFVDVDSMARVIVDLCVNATGIDIVNVGSGLVQAIGDVLNLLKANAPQAVEIVSVASRQRPNDRPFLCPDTSRLIRLNGVAAEPFSADTAARIFGEVSLSMKPSN